ncbi:MAG: Glu-tRNA(Gln) amidotransferase GatDE subunit E, partial [Candidatus Odinarchaeota archaeon]
RMNMPETIEKREKRFIKELGLSSDLAHQISRSANIDVFEQVVRETNVSPTLIAATLENTVVNLHRDRVPTENLLDRHFIDLFKLIEKKEVSTDAIPTLLTHLAQNPNQSIEEVLTTKDLAMASRAEIEETIKKIVRDREDFIQEQGERSIGGLMGIVMKELGGKVDGKIAKEILTAEVKKQLSI